MKPIIIYSTKFLDVVSIFFKVGGMSIFPFIFIRKERKGTILEKILITHETTHFYQTLELLIVGFCILYALNYIINFFIYKDIVKAYKNIVFEKEAYLNSGNFEYNKTRKPFSWIKYL